RAIALCDTRRALAHRTQFRRNGAGRLGRVVGIAGRVARGWRVPLAQSAANVEKDGCGWRECGRVGDNRTRGGRLSITSDSVAIVGDNDAAGTSKAGARARVGTHYGA